MGARTAGRGGGWATHADPGRLDQVDERWISALAAPMKAACEAWFGLEVRRLDLLPEGPALIVGNHDSGITFVEALGWGATCLLARPGERWHGLAHDGIVGLPGLGSALVRLGALRADPTLAAEALAVGRKVVVFPGGNLEAFRPYARRFEVDFGGRTGWVKLAIRSGVPIVPVVFSGGHAGFRVLADNRRLAQRLGLHRWLRVDTWPLVVGLPWGIWLGPMFHLPLPVKVVTTFLPPVPTAHLGAAAADDPAVVQAIYDQVTGAMEARLRQLGGAPPRRAA
jgi:1-acyl-sn-glycerol-3-phosphate acyltransferase